MKLYFSCCSGQLKMMSSNAEKFGLGHQEKCLESSPAFCNSLFPRCYQVWLWTFMFYFDNIRILRIVSCLTVSLLKIFLCQAQVQVHYNSISCQHKFIPFIHRSILCLFCIIPTFKSLTLKNTNLTWFCINGKHYKNTSILKDSTSIFKIYSCFSYIPFWF